MTPSRRALKCSRTHGTLAYQTAGRPIAEKIHSVILQVGRSRDGENFNSSENHTPVIRKTLKQFSTPLESFLLAVSVKSLSKYSIERFQVEIQLGIGL